MPKTKVNKTLFIVSLVLIIFAGAFFRVWQLDYLPPGLQYDEAYNGLDGLKQVIADCQDRPERDTTYHG